MELYQNDDMFAELCSQMYEYYRQRSSKLKECNINCLHLMPFLDTPEGRSRYDEGSCRTGRKVS